MARPASRSRRSRPPRSRRARPPPPSSSRCSSGPGGSDEMIRRTTKIQLILFVVITLLGLSYVSAEYVGLAKYVTGDDGCQVTADFRDSGGIFTDAEVTYRGVTVGTVGDLHLLGNGIRVDLDLSNCNS